jgi:hypothetical protein
MRLTFAQTLRSGLLCALVLAPGCTCDASVDAPPPPPSAKPAVPVPNGLVADLVVRAPATLLGELRQELAGPMLLMPRTLGGLVINLFGLPLSAAELVDERLPVYGATVVTGQGQEARLGSAVAIHVKDGGRLIARLTKGPDATFDGSQKGDLTMLAPKPALRQARLEAPLAVVDNYLVAGDSTEALQALGPYLARTAPRGEPSEHDVELRIRDSASSEPVRTRLAALRAPLEALPIPPPLRALVSPESLIEAGLGVLELMGEGTVTLDVATEAPLKLRARVAARNPLAAGVLASLKTIEPAKLADLPDDVVAAATWAQPPGEPSLRAASAAADIVSTTGLAVADRAVLEVALAKMAAGQGSGLRFGLRCTGVGLTGLADGEARDAPLLRTGLEELLALRKSKSVKARLEAEGMSLSVDRGRARHIPDDVHRIRIERKAPEGDEPPPPIDLRYVVTDDRFYAAAGMQSLETLQHLHAPDPEHRWANKLAIAAAVKGLPDVAWASVIIDPQGVNACLQGKPGGSHATPLTLSVGPSKGGLELRVDVAPGLLRALGGLMP